MNDGAASPAPTQGGSRSTLVARGVVVALLAATLTGTVVGGSHWFFFFLIVLALSGSLYAPLAWPPFGKLALGAFVVWPFVAALVFVKDDLAVGWFFVISACGWLIFATLAYCFSKTFRVAAHGWLGGARREVISVLPESAESLAARGVPARATVTTRETGAGTEYTVTWTDLAVLRDPDRKNSNFEILATMVVLLAFGLILGGSYGGIGHTMMAIGIFIAIVVTGIWIFRMYHERARYAARSVVFHPDGGIAINNPPSRDANRETDGHSLFIKDGLSRLVSVEYGKTSDWTPLLNDHVTGPGEWYDVFMLFDAETRVAVSRSFMRDHAHQVSGRLNELKARLVSTKPRRPKAERIID